MIETIAGYVFGVIIGLVGGVYLAYLILLVCCGERDFREHIRRGGSIMPPPLYPPKRKTGDES